MADLFSKVATPFCIPTSNEWSVYEHCNPSTSLPKLDIVNILNFSHFSICIVDLSEFLIFISLVRNDVKNLFMYFVIRISSFVKFLFKFVAYFSVGLFLFFSYKKSLYIPDTSFFVRYMFCKYFHPKGLSFFKNGVFQ